MNSKCMPVFPLPLKEELRTSCSTRERERGRPQSPCRQVWSSPATAHQSDYWVLKSALTQKRDRCELQGQEMAFGCQLAVTVLSFDVDFDAGFDPAGPLNRCSGLLRDAYA